MSKPNPFISVMPHLIDIGGGYYINMNSVSHIIDNEEHQTMAVYMYTSPVDRYGHIQPLNLKGTQRENMLNFIESMDVESTSIPPNTDQNQ